MPPLSLRAALIASFALASSACGTVSLFVTPEGNIAIGPRNAATGAPGGSSRFQDDPPAPRPHVARSAYDNWRPPPLGVLPPGNVLRNTSVPVRIQSGEVAVTLRASDRLVPAWGGDVYVRIDVRGAGAADRAPPRDLAVVVDTRGDRASAARARRLAADLFETLRPDDRGALVGTTEWGRVLVPLLAHGAAPLLIDRTRTFEARGADDFDAALEHAVPLLAESTPGRMRRLVVFSGSGALIQAEALEWMRVAQRSGVDVLLVPLTAAARARFAPLEVSAGALVLTTLPADDRAHAEAVEELSARPPAHTVAQDVSFVYEALPGPSYLIEVAGAQPLWTPSGGEIPLGELRAGERRTIVLRASVPPGRPGSEFEASVALRYRDASGPHEVRRAFTARYVGSPREHAASRAGDVLQYVSLLNTLSNVQAAIARSDADTLLALRDAAALQARSLERYAREHRDGIMLDQATLMLDLLAMPLAPPPPATPPPPASPPPPPAAGAGASSGGAARGQND